MVGIWVWLAALAYGQAVDVRVATAMVSDLVPQVERRTGRTFVRVPEVDIDTRAALRARLLRAPVRMDFAANLGRTDEPYRASSDQVERVEHLVVNAMALYASQDETVYLVEENLQEIGRSLKLAEQTLRPLLRCVLVHELVHALQHQYGVQGEDDADLERGRLALREGHAEHVAAEYCADVEAPATGRLLDAASGIELEASLPADGAAAVYSWGRRLAESLAEHDLVWPAMVGPAPSWSAIVDAIRPTHSPGWRSGDPLRAALGRLELGKVEVEGPVPASPTTFLTSLFQDQLGLDAMPRARGGFRLAAEADDRTLGLGAFLLEQPGAPEALLERRRAHIQDARTRGVPTRVHAKVNGALLRPPKAKRLDVDVPGVASALRVTTRTTNDGPYREYWFATERRLVYFVSAGRKLPEGEIARSVGGLLSTMTEEPGAALDLNATGAWIEAVRSIDPEISRHPSSHYLFGRAAKRVARGEQGACSSVFDGPLRAPEIPDRAPYARSAFECAAVASDLALAQRALRILPEVEPFAAVFLASKLTDEQRPRDALAMLDKADVRATGDARLIQAAAGVRAYAGSQLFAAGRRAEGRRILEEACPLLSPAERRRCAPFLRSR